MKLLVQNEETTSDSAHEVFLGTVVFHPLTVKLYAFADF
jgi:hypothetical protein